MKVVFKNIQNKLGGELGTYTGISSRRASSGGALSPYDADNEKVRLSADADAPGPVLYGCYKTQGSPQVGVNQRI